MNILTVIKNRLEPALWQLRTWNHPVKDADEAPLFDWSMSKIKRTDIINLLLANNKYSAYLEIGCEGNKNFSKIDMPLKIGVDPAEGGTHRMTSDVFFKDNKHRFDLVFIDGLHTYEQVFRDVENSLRCLNDGGTIVLHDMLPPTWQQEHVPRLSKAWNGTTWKIAYDLKKNFGNEFGIVLADQGVGVLFKNTSTAASLSQEDHEINKARTFGDFKKDYQAFNVMKPDDVEKFLLGRDYGVIGNIG